MFCFKNSTPQAYRLTGGACGAIENSDAQSAPEFGNTSCPALSTLAISLVENEPLTGFAAKNADVTHNGKVDLADLATLRQYLSKKIDKFE